MPDNSFISSKNGYFKMDAKTKFTYKYYKSSSFKTSFLLYVYQSFIDFFSKIQGGAHFQDGVFLSSFSRSSHIRQQF
jgi:hypothetical protein